MIFLMIVAAILLIPPLAWLLFHKTCCSQQTNLSTLGRMKVRGDWSDGTLVVQKCSVCKKEHATIFFESYRETVNLQWAREKLSLPLN